MYKLSQKVVRVAMAEGLTNDIVQDFVGHSAICSHERGNRRYHKWLFQVEGNEVVSMTYLDLKIEERKGSSGLTVNEECPSCEGVGCRDCGWVGSIQVVYN